MKEINQIIHLTESLDNVKSILKNGFYTSYAKENFFGINILIPMISFANILYRDIGESEVVNYGKYGIVFDRDFAVEKFDLNPVFYVKSKSEIESTFQINFENSIIPNILNYVKEFYVESNYKNITDHISFNPINEDIKNLLNTLDKNVNDEFIKSLIKIFESYFNNTLKQVLVLKPYKVKNKKGDIKIAYNEREWRKSFFDLNYILEKNLAGKPNKEYNSWLNKQKPHFFEKHILKLELSFIKCIYVDNENEIEELRKYINLNYENDSVEISTLTELKKRENTK